MVFGVYVDTGSRWKLEALLRQKRAADARATDLKDAAWNIGIPNLDVVVLRFDDELNVPDTMPNIGTAL
jgi:hypothetical protein